MAIRPRSSINDEMNKKLVITSYSSFLISSNMYIVRSGENIIVIDPHISDDALRLINSSSRQIDYIILTHEHYDHISGVNWLKETFNCPVICNSYCSEAIQKPNMNFSKYFSVIMEVYPHENEIDSLQIEPYSCSADIVMDGSRNLKWQGHDLCLIDTPGHSKGSISIILDNKYLFCGDSLLKDFPAATRIPGGSSKIYKEDTYQYYLSLAPEIIVFPGHYERFVLGNKLNSAN